MSNNGPIDAHARALEARIELGRALLEAGTPEGALEQFVAVLSLEPASLHALQGAAMAAAALGDDARAASYQRLLSALGHEAPSLSAGSDDGSEAVSTTSTKKQPKRDRLKVVRRGEDANLDWMAERADIRLADVAGMDTVKRRLNVAFLGPLRNPELRILYGKSLRGGLLLYGPPGCGKTFVARATAGELGAKFIQVGLTDVVDMYFGESERKLHEIFQTARRAAPAVLFFDEVDALGHKRSHLRHSGGRNVVAQFLAELDGVDGANDGIFVLGASNHPWDIDSALVRPGRFDRLLVVLPPDLSAREAILRLHLADRPVAELDLTWLAERTEGFPGADLAHLGESAAEVALEESLMSGTPRAITMDDFRAALRDVRPSTTTWFEAARNFAMFGNEGGMYDDLLEYMRTRNML